MVLVSECNLDCEQRELNTLANVIPSEDENSSICHQVVLPENDLIQVKNLEWSLFSLQYSVIWRWKDKQIHTPWGIPSNAYPFKIIRVENLYPFSAETAQKFLPLTPLQERKSVFQSFRTFSSEKLVPWHHDNTRECKIIFAMIFISRIKI